MEHQAAIPTRILIKLNQNTIYIEANVIIMYAKVLDASTLWFLIRRQLNIGAKHCHLCGPSNQLNFCCLDKIHIKIEDCPINIFVKENSINPQ